MLIPLSLRGQGTVNAPERDMGARIGVEADKKLMKGLHLTVEGEARFSDNFSNFGRYQAGAGLSYKINSHFKAGAGFLLIEKKNTSGEWKTRERFYADLTGSFNAGDWRFSLKERLQLTHREVNNAFQNNPNSLSLKSRFKVAYRGFSRSLTPYVYAEARNVFNDPACKASWNGTEYSDYEFKGYTHAYFNRLRGCLGAEYKIDRHNALDIFLLTDYCRDKNIDTNAEGTKLKSLTYDQGLNISLGLSYRYSF